MFTLCCGCGSLLMSGCGHSAGHGSLCYSALVDRVGMASYPGSWSGYEARLNMAHLEHISIPFHKAPMYYRRANAAIIVYDITQEKSFNEARDWAKGL